MHKRTFCLFLIALLVVLVNAAPESSAVSSSTSGATPSPSGSGKCAPIACTQANGKPSCPSACSENCVFVDDKCCPGRKIGVCNSSASASNTASATPTEGASSGISSAAQPTSSAASATTGASSVSVSGASSNAPSSSTAATSPSPSSSGFLTVNAQSAYLFSMTFGLICAYFLL